MKRPQQFDLSFPAEPLALVVESSTDWSRVQSEAVQAQTDRKESDKSQLTLKTEAETNKQ